MTPESAKSIPKAAKKKPIRLAKNWGAGILPIAGRAVIILFASVLLGMLFSGIISSKNALFRTAAASVVFLTLMLLYLQEGLRTGTANAAISRRIRRMEKDGYTPSPKEDASCWHPAKAVLALILVFLIPLLLAGYISMTAEPYRYSLQDLPQWLGTYANREDIMVPLSAYNVTAAPSVRIWIRMAVRLLEMSVIGFIADPLRNAELIDRIAPLVILLYPAAFLAGYLLGPRSDSRIATRERRSKKAAVRKAEKHTLAEELTRGGGEVHYGQRTDTRERTGKKLI